MTHSRGQITERSPKRKCFLIDRFLTTSCCLLCVCFLHIYMCCLTIDGFATEQHTRLLTIAPHHSKETIEALPYTHLNFYSINLIISNHLNYIDFDIGLARTFFSR